MLTPADMLAVTLVQADLLWHDPPGNRERLQAQLEPLAGQTDLIVLPEMFTTGFTMAAQAVAEPAGGTSHGWMRAMAARLGAVVTGSIATLEGGRYFNRLIWMRPDGTHAQYDKRHLFRIAGEERSYSPGTQRLSVDLHGWRVCPLICYDLRFPVFSRNRLGTPAGYDLLLYVANWPQPRRHAWQTLLRARAIENLCYCIGVNRVGRDAAGTVYQGDSAAIDFLGQELLPPCEGEVLHTVRLERAALQSFRTRFPAHLDADAFQLG